MFNNNLFRKLLIVLTLGLSITFTACSNSSSGDKSYSGPGSKWDVTLRGDGTFEIKKYASASATTEDFGVTGNHTTLSTGFKKLTVTGVTGSGGPSVGDAAYGLEVSGYVFALKPLSGDQLISMVVGGTCPTTDIDANWVKVNMGDGANLLTNDVGGSFHFDFASGNATLPARYLLGGTDQGSNSVGAGSCADGIMTVGGTAEMYLTSSGGAIVNTDITDSANSEFIFGFAQKAITDVNSLDGDYAGLVFTDSSAVNSKVEPVSISCNAGVCTGNAYTNVETGATSTEGVILTLNGTPDHPGTGFILGDIDQISGGTTGNVVCMIDKNAANTGKTIGSCVGQDPGDTTKLFNVLFVSK